LRRNVMKKVTGFVLLASMLFAGPVRAQSQPRSTDIWTMSLEDLLNIEITSASRKQQRVEDTAAAVFVLTQDDIRRSGATTMPEVLRLVPGVNVSQVNSSSWAVSIRGFNNVFANKLLVLVDGRTIYTATFSGVLWNGEDLLLEDVERIEVVRGPGGAVWGANAVNGVINIITKSTADTQGGAVHTTFGVGDGPRAAMRYGGAIGQATYRAYVQTYNHGDTTFGQVSALDNWNSSTVGGRLDWQAGPDSVHVQGRFTNAGTVSPTLPTEVAADGSRTAKAETPIKAGSVLGRWTRTGAGGGALAVQSFVNSNWVDLSDRGDRARELMTDVDVQYHVRPLGRHDLVVGGGYRRMISEITGGFEGLRLTQPRYVNSVTNMFAQDEIRIAAPVRVTFGSRFERHTLSGWNAQPTARVMWDLDRSRQQRLWASISQAVRTPSVFDVGLETEFSLPPAPNGIPMSLVVRGNPDYRPERFTDVEAGYRLSLGATATIDVTGFRGRFTDLPLVRPLAPEFVTSPPRLVLPMQTQNLMDATTNGVEIAGRWLPTRGLLLDGSYTALSVVNHRDPASLDQLPALSADLSPGHQWQLRPTVLFPRGEMSVGLFRVGAIDQLSVPAYTRVDSRVELRLTRGFSASVVGQNLSSPSHPESAGTVLFEPTLVPRRVQLQINWRM
jgi:iron complex outermembrane receptor protein